MSEVKRKPQNNKKGAAPVQEVPPTILSEQLSTYAFGTVTAGAVMVAVAAWMGGSLASIDERVQSGWDATAEAAGLTIAEISIEGLDPRTKADVLNALSIKVGDNMFRADPFKIKQEIEAEVRNLADVQVLRQWPNDVWIIADTRKPLALWQTDGAWTVVDQSGTPIMDSVDPAEHVDLPRVVGPAGGYAAPILIKELKLHPEIAERMVAAMRVGERRWDIRLESGLEISLPEDARMDEALLAVFDLNEATGVLDQSSDVTRIDARDPERFAVGLGASMADASSKAGGA